MPHCQIVAEAGVNHNGDLALARQLIDAAADTGADWIKFQTFAAERLVTPTAAKADYQNRTTDAAESQLEMLQRLELTPKMHDDLVAYSRERKIGFLSTGFDIESLNYLRDLGLETFKIPSGEITNLPYLRSVGSFSGRILLSTGMANLGEIEAALGVLEDSGTPRERITVLHCTTEYPAPLDEVNLRAMTTIRHAFGVTVGYSDHTDGIEISLAAVALGAVVIEKHITLNRSLPGPDHAASLEPRQFRDMVRAIRNVERAMGDRRKQPTMSELPNRTLVRKSLVAIRTIRAGEPFTPKNVGAKRPATGLSPMRWDEVMGKLAPRQFGVDEAIEL